MAEDKTRDRRESLDSGRERLPAAGRQRRISAIGAGRSPDGLFQWAVKAGNPVFGEKAPDVLAVAAMLGHEPRDLKEIDVFRIVGPVKLGRPRRPSCQQTGVVDRRVNHAEVMPAAAPYACIRSIKSGNSRRMNAMFFRK